MDTIDVDVNPGNIIFELLKICIFAKTTRLASLQTYTDGEDIHPSTRICICFIISLHSYARDG